MSYPEAVLECPKCKKTGLVRLHDDGEIFECVYCRHKEDLGKSSKGGNLPGLFFTGLLAVLVTLLMLGV